ncbi:Rrg8p SKDI_16G3740 [Saccharomyces kudriavzevii IFO 1802]|uniref:Required for respiratory growth protein 8, mitochondrial n=2 Tax=Saccharomyces kudriavzevii (strain ATCC MYA-4449 / AS 2.2408 / CBS 8840 / NBRC 1802 / NCYC 2889) TaxID=226230 RepID=J6EJD8_SACK1|nr:uncharacterized protein SKDI_16G3740 [Saccharomyces kudriavzevii IFO 1802]EJT43387.1 RRG8-like protein [Saccharomyces kudriavzevii IFO 1802]CAI4054013.1 hypothetical protein SKDI_16G3740 [Saccharomyces kudriavzevii IFO 1802]
MGLPKSLYKKLLIDVPAKGANLNCRQSATNVSPVVTNFEKWSGKRRKIYFKDEEEMMIQNHLENFNLRNNVYGRILASPMRAEKISKLKSCRELLIPLKVVSTDEKDHIAENSKLKLVPILEYSRPCKSSYILNSASIVRDNLAAGKSWFPLSILQSSTQKKLVLDTSTFISEYSNQLLELIRARLTEASNVEPSPKNRVLVTYDETNTAPIEIERIEDGELRVTQSVFNLSCLQAPALEATMNKDEANKGIYLDADHDKDLIKHLYRIILFSLM